MKNIHFSVSDPLLKEINRCVERWGFMSQAEFLRFLVIDFARNDRMFQPTDDTLKEHTKAIRQITARKDLAKCTKEWLKHGDTKLY